MPCGGIYPVHQSVNAEAPPDSDASRCLVCDKPGSDLWVEEWDSGIHRDCLGAFLSSEEGRVVLDHGHEIFVPAVDRAGPPTPR